MTNWQTPSVVPRSPSLLVIQDNEGTEDYLSYHGSRDLDWQLLVSAIKIVRWRYVDSKEDS